MFQIVGCSWKIKYDILKYWYKYILKYSKIRNIILLDAFSKSRLWLLGIAINHRFVQCQKFNIRGESKAKILSKRKRLG